MHMKATVSGLGATQTRLSKAMHYQCRTAGTRAEDANLLDDDDDDDQTRGSGSRFGEVVNHHSCKFMNLQQKM